MVRRRSACLLLSITTAVRRDRPTGDRATERHKVFAADRRGSEARNLRPLKFASGLDPDEKLEAIEVAGPAALRQRPFDLPTADCRPKGLSVMESQISKVYAPSNATGRQLTITKIAHKAAVVGDRGVGAVLAARDVSAEGRRAAALDGAHHLELGQAHMTAVGMTPRGPVVAENVRDLQSWTGHVDPLRWRLVLLRHQWRQPVQWAYDLTDDVGGHLGVARRGVELGRPEQNLYHTNIDVVLEQVRAEAVSQRVLCHSISAVQHARRP